MWNDRRGRKTMALLLKRERLAGGLTNGSRSLRGDRGHLTMTKRERLCEWQARQGRQQASYCRTVDSELD